MFERDLFGDEVPLVEQGSTLSETWAYPPFSVLNAREGWWQDRPRQWLALGFTSELGRGGGLTMGDSPQITEPGLNYYRNRNK